MSVIWKSVCLFACLVFVLPLSHSQEVSIDLQVPSSIRTGDRVQASLVITKGSLDGFARLQQNFPTGISVSPLESAGADFSFEDGKLNLIWLKMPSEPQFSVSYLIIADERVSGRFRLGGRFSYLKDNNRSDLELEAMEVNILPAGTEGPVVVTDPVRTHSGDTEKTAQVQTTGHTPACYRQKPGGPGDDGVYRVEVLVDKGDWNRSGMLEEEVLNGYEIRPLESKGARFSFEAGKARFVWLKMPVERFLLLSYELVPRSGDIPGPPLVKGQLSLVGGNESIVVAVSERPFTLSDNSQEGLRKLSASLHLDTSQPLSTPAATPPQHPAATAPSTPVAVPAQAGQTRTSSPAVAETRGVAFGVQIAATGNPVNEATHFRQFNVQETVLVDMDKGLYKYTVGRFKTYREAKEMRDRLARTTTLEAPFVCAFRDGKRIPLDEALRLTGQK